MWPEISMPAVATMVTLPPMTAGEVTMAALTGTEVATAVDLLLPASRWLRLRVP